MPIYNKDKLLAALDYQSKVVDEMDLNAVLRAVCTAAPGVHERPVRHVHFMHGPNGKKISIPVGDSTTPAPIEYPKVMDAARTLCEQLIVNGKLRDGWRDIVAAAI